MPVNTSNGDSIHMPADYYIVKVRDFGEDYAYPYESLEEAQDFMTQCKLPRTLWPAQRVVSGSCVNTQQSDGEDKS